MNLRTRLILFFLKIAFLIAIFYSWHGVLVPDKSIPLIIFTALIALALTSFFIESFFTKPVDVIATTFAILLLLFPVQKQLTDWGIWYNIFFVYTFLCFIISFSAILFFDKAYSPDSLRNKISYILNQTSTKFGNGKILFSVLFLLSVLFYKEIPNNYLLLLILLMFFSLAAPKLNLESIRRKIKTSDEGIGKIIGVQSKNIFIVKLYQGHKSIKRFNFVEFIYSIDKKNKPRFGLIIDNFLLNEEQWIKVLVDKKIQNSFMNYSSSIKYKPDVVYKIQDNKKSNFLDTFVGIITRDSTINKIRFEYESKKNIFEGSLLEITVKNNGTEKEEEKNVLYQVTQGVTDIKKLESKNEAGLIIGEATQLGYWNTALKKFEKYSWVPEINSSVHTADITLKRHKISEGKEISIGKIPETKFDVIINKEEGVKHHLAILGVTGSGKSVFSRHLIKEIAKMDKTKVICIDFTAEYKNKFSTESTPLQINDNTISVFGNLLQAIETGTFGAKPERAKYQKFVQGNLIPEIKQCVNDFIDDKSKKISVLELLDICNTSASLEYTRWFFQALFDIAKNKPEAERQNICLVLEEAHTIIPEWNSMGVNESNKMLVNAVGQIALQGRKYGIGLVIIAQRTANVSKTILTQCNSIIAFQQFDQTSKDFLSNYMGTEMVQMLPHLKQRQAIAFGKAFKANIPMIFEVNEITE